MDHPPTSVLGIGGGIMGCGIAAGFAAQGGRVTLLVREAARIDSAAQQCEALLQSLQPAPGASAIAVQAMDDFKGWDGLGLVIESITEDLALKQALFAGLDARVPAGVPIGSNSSSHGISRIAAGLSTRSRMFNMHYFMPAHRVPLVEVVLGADSDAALAQQVCALFAAHGKKPVLVQRDIPGFLANRIQHALMREVLSLIDSGIASPEDVDLAVRYSFGFRYAAIGPVLQKEISGWDTQAAAAREIYPSLCNSTELPACLTQLLAEGRTGMKRGAGFIDWTPEAAQALRADYDRRLAAALKLLD